MKYTLVVLWCFVFCVKSDDGYKFERPTPVVKVLSRIQSTDQLNPLKVNVQSELKPLTTEAGILLNPTSRFKLQTTSIATRGINDAPVRNQLTTTFVGVPNNNPSVNPTSVINGMRLETGAENPTPSNLPVTPPLFTTAVVDNGQIKPTPVLLTTETKPVAVALTNDDEPVILSTGNVPWNFIEPSLMPVKDVPVNVGHTSQLEQEFIKESTLKPIDVPVSQNVVPCTCKYFEEPSVSLDYPSYDTNNALTPQLFTPQVSKPNVPDILRPPNDVRQLIISLQLNLYLNNFPIIAAHAVPLYF